MNVVEPCCFNKQLNALVERMDIGKGNHQGGPEQAVHFFSNSDWSLDELLHYVTCAVPSGDLTLCLVKPTAGTLQLLHSLMTEKIVDNAAEGTTRPLISHLNLITQPQRPGDFLDQRAEIQSQLGEYIQAGRMAVCEDVIGFRCICIANGKRYWVIQGSLNQEKNYAMQMFTMTTSQTAYRDVMEMMDMKVRMKSIFKKRKE